MNDFEKIMKNRVEIRTRKVIEHLGGQVTEDELHAIRTAVKGAISEEKVADTIRAMRILPAPDKDKALILADLISAVRGVLKGLTNAQSQAIAFAFGNNLHLTFEEALEIARAVGNGNDPTRPGM